MKHIHYGEAISHIVKANKSLYGASDEETFRLLLRKQDELWEVVKNIMKRATKDDEV